MSIDESGLNGKISGGNLLITIKDDHPLIQLGAAVKWDELAELTLPDLKASTGKGHWWMGRPLRLRIHLGAYLLQQLFNKTDRQTEYDIKDNAVYQIFCGRNVVGKWHVPDHTKIEKFRSRLSRDTQKELANYMAAHAVKLGFGDPSEVDIDSTVQEANMTYPADSVLLKKLGVLSAKVANFLNEKFTEYVKEPIRVNMKKISSKAREYFFLPKNATKEVKNEKLTSLLNTVTEEVTPIIHACEKLDEKFLEKITWNFKKTIIQIKEIAKKYLEDVRTFLTEGFVVPTKRISFHLKEVACFTKGKLGKKYQFGRAFQLGRIKGNFFFVTKCTSIQMDDKQSLSSIIQEHKNIFNQREINSVSTDKGYYSKNNEKLLAKNGVNDICIQRPSNIKKPHPKPMKKEREEELINRRSGIEPLIGHIKQGGQLGRSRMKSDTGIECSGYTSVLGFNMRQIIKHQKLSHRKKTA
jgi:transposase, IS5 family